MKGKALAVCIVSILFLENKAHAQYDDSPGSQYTDWAIGQICRVAGQGVTVGQATGLLPSMIMGGQYATVAAMQDFQRVSRMNLAQMKNLTINISNGVLRTCPNNIGRSEYDSMLREQNYFNRTGNVCTQWEGGTTEGRCLNDM
jgi:hypothetical protein